MNSTRTRHPRRATRRLVGLAAAAGAAAAAVGLRRRHAAVAAVRPELRSPALYLPVSVGSERSLRVLRTLMAARPSPTDPATMTTDHRTTDGVRVLLHQRPDRQRPSPAVLWLHGGGTVMGRPEGSTAICSRMAAELDALVVNVDYRLAPEHPFPAGLDDCMSALRWIHDHAKEYGIDPSRIAVGGESAGGGLAAAVTQRAVDEGGPELCFQALVYPMLDDRTVLRADHGGRGTFIWTPASNRFAWTAYLGHPPTSAPERPYAAPARRADLSGLPPAWIGAGELDLFLDEDVDYATRLEAAGVPCELRLEPGTYHGADALLPDRGPSREFRDHMVATMGRHLEPTG
ncbi:MAG: alpha/beta hydrolase [Acidimicrobiia bacterium]|nr:alpha/beta hydrolase [Acidimicrobiia bacterium]